MTTYVLLPGAGGQAWYWHRVEPLLAPHRVVNVDLPADDEAVDLDGYRERTLLELGEGTDDVVVVGQSMGAYTAALVVDHLVRAGRPVRLVFLNAMLPQPGETAGQWWEAVDQESAARAAALLDGRDPDAEFDVVELFFHDTDPALTAYALANDRDQSSTAFATPFEVRSWLEAPTTIIASRDDRLFPLELQQRLARERFGQEVVVVDGGHLSALSHPDQIAAAILHA